MRPSFVDGRRLACLLLEGAVALVVLFVSLDGWHRDFRVPFFFSYDALEYLMQVKGTLENGWWWVHPRLSAPGVFHQVLYPSNTTVDQAIVWIVGLTTSEPGLAINASWMIMVALSAAIASRSVMLLAVPARAAVPVGLLFALSPYALYKHVDHFSLAIYLVPVPCTVALLAATGRIPALTRSQFGALLAGCALLGLNYPYYAFFACFLIAVSMAIAFAAEWRFAALRAGVPFLAAICVTTVLNLAPSLYASAEHGKPSVIPVKRAAEAEQYGLKIRHLITPVAESTFGPFDYWNDLGRNANYPLETENKSSRLGTIATIGFLALILSVFVPPFAARMPDGTLFAHAGRLTLAAVLLATIGGFGSVFNLLVTPDIRAYSRIAPFIAFFSGVAVSLLAERLRSTGPNKLTQAILALALVLGIYDQTRALESLNHDYGDIRQEWTTLTSFVQTLESRLPDRARVFQLPQVAYLNETGRERMLPLDHLKPYVVSSRIHWSYPAISDDIVRWQLHTSRLPPPLFAAALADEGFAALLVDRNGYDDRGVRLLEGLGLSADPGMVLVENERYVALDLPRMASAIGGPGSPANAPGSHGHAAAQVPACGLATRNILEWIGSTSISFTQQPIAVPRSDFIVTGWAVDDGNQSIAGDVDIVLDGRVVPALYGIERADVAAYLGATRYQASGFAARIREKDLRTGETTLSVRILSADRRCSYDGARVRIVAR